MKAKTKKILRFIFIAICGIIIGIVVSFYILLQLSIPKRDGSLKISQITKPVEIIYDKMGIPQIWAENENDACFALGYQQASDRLFQMDMTRRVSQGRLSEMLGNYTQSIDIEQRRIGHYRLAKKALASLSPENRSRLQAFTDGINAYVEHCGALPFEYRFLPIKFKRWEIIDCLALLSFQTWFSNALLNIDEFNVELAKIVGDEKASSLSFPYPDWGTTTVPPNDTLSYFLGRMQNNCSVANDIKSDNINSRSYSIYKPIQRSITQSLFTNFRNPLTMSNSSNAWVIAPQKSTSGYAMLASDPHLELSRLPQFWYAVGVHINKNTTGVLGISTPGLPFIIMGHNGSSAYAFTAGGTSLLQHIKRKINPENPNQYFDSEKWCDFHYIEDTFYVIGQDSPLIDTFRLTTDGPVISEDSIDNIVYVLKWAGYETDLNDAITNAFKLHKVHDFEEFRKITTNLGALDANMFYADSFGNIGYQLTSPIPIVNKINHNNSDFGTDLSTIWKGFSPLKDTPHAKNPRQGWLASCNNMPSRNPQTDGYFYANRIISITELLNSKNIFSSDDIHQYQMDQKDRYLKRYKNEFVNILNLIEKKNLAEKIDKWDGSASKKSEETALINIYLSKLKKVTFSDELNDLYKQIPAKWIENIDAINKAGWFDDVTTEDTIETYIDVAKIAMQQAVDISKDKNWGQLHTFNMAHPMAVIPVIGGLLDLSTEIEAWSGTPGTLNASFFRENDNGTYKSIAGPSWRFIVDFADINSVTMVLPAGNSGNPMSDHFMDFYEMWKKGEQWTVPFNYDKVKENSVSSLMLLPASINQ